MDAWLRRISSVQAVYGLDDNVVKMLAINKFSGKVQRWYNIQESLWNLSWNELADKLKEVFSEAKDTAKIMEKMRARKWNRHERLEDYYMIK